MEDVATNLKLLCFDTAQRHYGLLPLYLMIGRCRKETELPESSRQHIHTVHSSRFPQPL